MPTSNNNQDASAAKMQDPIDDRCRFHADDMKLLKTGRFSDARILVGDRCWNVHKSIVCMRSGFLSKAFSGQSKAGEGDVFRIGNYPENQVELLLEFIYSGRIKAIDDLKAPDCVQLSTLGEHFDVHGMDSYAEKALWRKLSPYVQPAFTVPSRRSSCPPLIDIRKLIFNLDFKGAIHNAYGGSGKACQLLLADFVWMAHGWLLHDPAIEQLNTTYPLLGSHILTTLTKGPQSSFVRADPHLMSIANNSASAWDTNRSRARIEAPPPQGSLGVFSARRF